MTTAKSAAPKPSAPRNPAHASGAPKPGPPRPSAPKPGPPRPSAPAAAASVPAPAAPPAQAAPATPTTPPAASAPAPAAPTVPAARQGGRPAGPDIRLVPATPDTALDIADDSVDRLLDQGAAPDSILVLTTGDPHPWQQHEESFGAEQYWRQYTEGRDVFYARALNDRQLRRETVVLVVNGFADPARSTDALVSAIGAGTGAVIVCGDLDQVRALTGL
ncbi:hypothetical protein [Yinghuangia sp. YIM S09857]|uniref:hypothetical protein n=1 Tax=Yinghuangia sp. YIM S09857 TaxID=3436929 RepID=UPI003F536EAD